MLYVIMGHDKDGSAALRAQTRPAHVEYIKPLIAEGRLVIAGPRPKVDGLEPGTAGFHGSLIIAEFADLAAARAWADGDPYMTAGVFTHVDVQPFIKALP